MKTHLQPWRQQLRRQKGFALIVTLTLMVLLTMIALGMLSLSSVSMRQSSRESVTKMAQSNARLALMVALGELQNTMGVDQAVSAPASAVVTNAPRPHMTGAWKSWRWIPTPGGSPDYSQKKDKFERWLVSTADAKEQEDFAYGSAAVPTGAESVKLVGSLQDSQGVSTEMIVSKVPIKNTNYPGKMAWAVFDESTKASIDLTDPTTVPTGGDEVASRSVPDRMRPDILDSKLSSLKTPKNLVSLETAVIPGGVENAEEFNRRFHDFSVNTLGLLTDTANGGLKKDLTQIFEPQTLPTGVFDNNTTASPYQSSFPATAGAPSWTYLADHYRKYKTISASDGIAKYTPSATTDLKIETTGQQSAPVAERLIPALAKVQLIFSIVSHTPLNEQGRRQYLDNNGIPAGSGNYGVPMLVMDPVVTLVNPYDVELDLAHIRIRIWDPPVGFRFKKEVTRSYPDSPATGTFDFRSATGPAAASSGFSTMAQFQNGNQDNYSVSNRRSITLLLVDGTGGAPGTTLKLQPGEVKVFSPHIPTSWKWENNGYNSGFRFFNHNAGEDATNVDKGDPNGLGRYGVICVPGWDTRAGMQLDHLSSTSTTLPRPIDSLYIFKNNTKENATGFVTMRKEDRVHVEAKPLVIGKGTSDFQVDVLAGNFAPLSLSNPANNSNNAAVDADRLRSYKFDFTNSANPSSDISADPANPVITKSFAISSIFQADADTTSPKQPFASLELSARPTKDDLTDNKPWLYNNYVVEGGLQNASVVGLSNQSYDLRFREVTSLSSFPGGVEFDPTTKRGYFGASGTATEGSSFVPTYKVQQVPAASLGDLIATNIISSSVLPRVVHPLGNSRAHPLISANKVSEGNTMLDHSYLLNDALWDSYFFSSLTDYSKGLLTNTRSMKEVLTGVLGATKPAFNTRLVPAEPAGDSEALATKIQGLSEKDRALQMAKYFAIKGPFNVNSTSVDAWRSVLSSLRDRTLAGLQVGASGAGVTDTQYANADKVPFARMNKPMADSITSGSARWGAFLTLTDEQIENLAKSIVQGITARGQLDQAPPLSLGEFVNRRIGNPDGLNSLAGILQTAIDNSSVNQSSISADSKNLSVASVSPERKKGVKTSQVMNGHSGEGAPTMLTQGDLMTALAPVATVRGDTFKIRSYGEVTTPDGKTILARAWCEAVVQRSMNFVDPVDPPETVIASLTSQANKTFGRRFNVVSFRWLNESEL